VATSMATTATSLERVAAVGFEVQSLNASEIMFSQSSVRGVGPIAETMGASGWVVPPIDVVAMGGRMIALDNTRLLAASMTGTPVQAIVRSASEALPPSMAGRFVSRSGVEATTFGEAVTTRIGKQNATYRGLFPNGSWATGVTN
jgi:hypothetical protein